MIIEIITFIIILIISVFLYKNMQTELNDELTNNKIKTDIINNKLNILNNDIKQVENNILNIKKNILQINHDIKYIEYYKPKNIEINESLNLKLIDIIISSMMNK